MKTAFTNYVNYVNYDHMSQRREDRNLIVQQTPYYTYRLNACHTNTNTCDIH